MIETITDCNRFELENFEGDLIMHVIPVEEDKHPAINQLSILFVRNLLTQKTYYFAFNHPDSKPNIDGDRFIRHYLQTLPNRKWVLDKKAFMQMLDLPNVYDVNWFSHLQLDEIFSIGDYETPAHYLVRKHGGKRTRMNLAIPLMKHLEMFGELAEDISNLVKKYEADEGFIKFNKLIIDTLSELEKQGIFVDRDTFSKNFKSEPNAQGLVFSQYNIYTSTGRPSNSFGGINYAALPKENGCRRSFVSRHGKDGRMVLIDYTTFHPRIICYLTKYSIPIETDIYAYLAKLYFQKKEVDETDIKESKNLTFRQLFGGVEDKYAHIKYLANLKLFIDTQWDFFQKNGYVLTPILNRKITAQHIKTPNPPKVFNYILQATEGEIAIPRIKMVMDYLKGKKTCAVLYTYDAVLYDFHKDDGLATLDEIRKIMSINGMFPMKTYVGENYHNMPEISI